MTDATRASTPSLNPTQVQYLVGQHIPKPPDGGYGWVVVFAAFMLNFMVDGFSYSFVEFKSDYSNEFQASDTLTALTGSLVVGVSQLSGPIVSALINRFQCRIVAMAGCVFAALAFFLSTFSPNIIVFILIYGVLGGFGMGLIYFPGLIIVSTYFESKRAIASGVSIAGTGLGSMLMPFAINRSIHALGWKFTLYGFSAFLLLSIAFALLYKPLVSPVTDAEQDDQMLIRGLADFDNDSIGGFDDTFHEEAYEDNVPEESQDYDAESGTQSIQRLYSALSGCDEAENGSAMPVRCPPSPEVVQQAMSRARANSFKRFPSSRARRLVASSTDDVAAIRRSDEFMSGRFAARNFARSLWRFASVEKLTKPVVDDVIQSIDPVEFTRPLNRRDIFYQGSLQNVPEIRDTGKNLDDYRESMISIPSAILAQGIANVNTEEVRVPAHIDEKVSPQRCKWLPLSIRLTLSEMFDVSLLKNRVMIMLCISNLLAMLGFYVPFVFLKDLALKDKEDKYHGVPENVAGYFVSIIGLTNTLGRLFFGFIACSRDDPASKEAHMRIRAPLNLSNVGLLVCGVSTLLAPHMISIVGLISYCLVFGFFISAVIVMTSLIIADLMGMEKLTSAFGIILVFRGVACLVGSPLAGFVFDMTKSYPATFYYSGFMLTMAGIVAVNIPAAPTRQRRKPDPLPVKELPPDNSSGKLSVLTERSEEDLTDYQRTIQSLRQQAALLNELEAAKRLKKLPLEHDLEVREQEENRDATTPPSTPVLSLL